MPLDTSETSKITNGIQEIADSLLSEAPKVLEKGALEIKRALQADAKLSRHFKQIAPTISYETTKRGTTTEVEIGPDKDRGTKAGRPGPLANIAYFGGANGGGGSLDFDGPVERELEVIDGFVDRIGVGK